jgi:hypothetical protein
MDAAERLTDPIFARVGGAPPRSGNFVAEVGS